MVPAILGQKIGMTQIFDDAGKRVPVTVVRAGPCVILQVKQQSGRDGYSSVQLGFDDVKPHRTTLSQIGHARRAKSTPKRFIREIRLDEPSDREVGDVITVDLFASQDVQYVDVIGTTKGRGFQGGMKRHGFGGQPKSHGVERKHRSPGSIGGRASNLGCSGSIKKGKRMAGHMGHVRRTIPCQRLIGVDTERHMLLIEGGVPGAMGGYVIVRQAKTRR